MLYWVIKEQPCLGLDDRSVKGVDLRGATMLNLVHPILGYGLRRCGNTQEGHGRGGKDLVHVGVDSPANEVGFLVGE